MSKYAAVNVKFGADISQFSTAMQNAAREMKKAGDQLKNVGQSMTMNLTAPIVALGAAALYSFGQIDSLKRGLISFSGSAQLAEEEFTKLREVAKLPGIGLEEAVKGSINLQAIGLSADDARTAMTAFGNAIATVGGGKENFDLAIRGFGQLTNASKPLQQDLYQIANQLPQVNKLMIEAFGTNRAEDLAAMGISGKQLADFLVQKLGELPKVSGGIKNAFENMSDSVKISLASFGEAIEKNFNISGKIDALASGLNSLVEGFKNLSPFTQSAILTFTALAAAAGPLIFAIGTIIKLLPTLMAGFAVFSNAIPYLKVLGLIVTGISIAYELFGNKTQTVKANTDTLNNSIAEETGKLNELFSRLKATNGISGERNRLITEINSKYGTHLKNIQNEATFLKTVEDAYIGVISKIKEKLILDSMNEKLTASIKNQIVLEEARAKAISNSKEAQQAVNDANAAGATMGEISSSNAFKYTKEALRLEGEITKEKRNQINLIAKGAKALGPTGGETIPGNAGLTPEQIKKAEDDKWKAFLESKGRQMDDIKQRNGRVIKIMEAYTDNVDKTNSKLISGQLKTNVAYKSVLDTSALDLDLSLSFQLETWRRHYQTLSQFTQKMNDILISSVQNAMIDLASAFGENLVDGDPFKDLGNVILSSLGKLMIALGTAMITFSSIFVAFKKSITAMQPEIAIPLGIAMVAAGAAISKIAAKGMQGSTGNYSTSTNSTNNSSSSGGNLTLTTRVDGRDLVISGNNTGRVVRR
jgi:tape measure domain-containing protein